MKNTKFWDECNNYSIRKKVAEFIEKTPKLSKLKNKDYYAFEDAMVNFIFENRDMISQEVDLEYHRDDLLAQLKEEFSDEVEETLKVLPIEIVDNIIKKWQDALGDNDEYWAIIWETLSQILTDGGVSPFAGINNYDIESILIYCAYLNEWYSDMPPEMQGETPACIDEFFSNEMEDEELSQYYIKIAQKMFGNKIKPQ